MGVSVDKAVNEVFYERSQTFVRESLINSGKKPESIHVVCYPEVTEADVRAYSGLGVPQGNITDIKGRNSDIDVLSIAGANELNENVTLLLRDISADGSLSDRAVVATHFCESDFDGYAIPKIITTFIALGMNYANLNPVFARNPQCDEYAAKIMHGSKKLEAGETDLINLLVSVIQDGEGAEAKELEKFHISPKGIIFHWDFLKMYVIDNGFPIQFADLAVYYEGKSHTPSRHWSYRYKTEPGQNMLVDLFLLDRFREVLEKYKSFFDKIYNGLEGVVFDSEEKKQLFFRDLIRDCSLIGRIVINIFNQRYKRKELQPVRKAEANDVVASDEEDFEAFVEEIRKQGVLIFDRDVKRSGKNRERLGLNSKETKSCDTVEDIRGLGRRGIEYYMSQQQFGLYMIQGSDSTDDVENALLTIGLNSNGYVPRVLIIDSSSEKQVSDFVESLRKDGIEVSVEFLDSTNGHLHEKTKLADVLRKLS